MGYFMGIPDCFSLS